MAVAVGDIAPGAPVHLAIRPERIGLAPADDPIDIRFKATVEGRIYHGDHQRLLARLASGQVLTVKIDAEAMNATGETIDICWAAAECRAFAVDKA